MAKDKIKRALLQEAGNAISNADQAMIKEMMGESGAPSKSLRPKMRPKKPMRPKARPKKIGASPSGNNSTRGIDPKENYSPEDFEILTRGMKKGGKVKAYKSGGSVRGYESGGAACRGGGKAMSGTKFRGVR